MWDLAIQKHGSSPVSNRPTPPFPFPSAPLPLPSPPPFGYAHQIGHNAKRLN